MEWQLINSKSWGEGTSQRKLHVKESGIDKKVMEWLMSTNSKSRPIIKKYVKSRGKIHKGKREKSRGKVHKMKKLGEGEAAEKGG